MHSHAFTCLDVCHGVGQLMVTTAPVAGSICGVWVLLWGSCELPVPRVTGSWLLIPCGWLQMMWVEDIDLFVCFDLVCFDLIYLCAGQLLAMPVFDQLPLSGVVEAC